MTTNSPAGNGPVDRVVGRQERDFRFENYLREEHKSIADSNACEHRPTYKSEIDAATALAEKLYARGKEMVKEIGQEDLARCRRLYSTQHSYRADDFCQGRLLGQWVIVPRYVFWLDDVRKAREAVL